MTVKMSAFSGAGATLSYKIGGASVFTPVGQLVEFEEGGTSVDDIETTLLSSLAKSFIPSIPDSGDISLTVQQVPGDTTVAELRTLVNTPQVVAWQIMYPDGTTLPTGSTETFAGYVNSYAPKGFVIGEAVTADIGIKITGLITSTPGT
jgi:Lambda phage tail tube protein, TTP